MSQTITAFTRIQKGIDNLISQHGTESTADLIESLSLEKNHLLHTYNINLQKLIVKQVVETFRINHKLLSTAPDEKYRKARQCCFALLSIHCKMSSREIKKQFPKYTKTRSNISAQIKIMQGIIELPAIDKVIHEKFCTIEKQIIKYKNTNNQQTTTNNQ